VIPSDITRYGIWKRANPDGQVLSRDTGFFRNYNSIPYGGDLENIKPFFPVANSDSRLDDNAYVIGIIVHGKARAYLFDAVKKMGEVIENFQGKTIVAKYVNEIDSVRIFERGAGGLTQLSSVPSFWFSWVAVYPDTELYK